MAYGAVADQVNQAGANVETNRVRPEVGRPDFGIEANLDLDLAERIASESNRVLMAERESILAQIKQLHLVANPELNEKIEAGEFPMELIVIADRYEPLAELASTGAIKAQEYLDGLQAIKSEKEFSPELEGKVALVKEIRGLAYEGVIARSQIKEKLSKYSTEAGADSETMQQLSDYEDGLIADAQEAMQARVLTEAEFEEFRGGIKLDNISIMGTPRISDPQAEMTGAKLAEPMMKLKQWQQARELSQAGLITEAEMGIASVAISQNEMLPPKIAALSQGLERLRYARFMGIVGAGEDYEKAISLLPIIAKEKLACIIDSEIETGEEAQVAKERPELVKGENDPIKTEKGFLILVISAWEDSLGWQLKDEFKQIFDANEARLMEAVREQLIALNSEFVKDQRATERKREDYLNKIRVIIGENLPNNTK